MFDMQQRLISIRVLRNASSDLMVAVSDDLTGLIVHGRSEDELRERIPTAIRAVLEADGHTVAELNALEADTPPGFKAEPRYKYDARLAA